MVAGGALLNSLQACHIGKGYHTAVCEYVPSSTKPAHAATSFAGQGGGAPGAGAGGKEGKLKKMGRTDEDEPCECTDPDKKKPKGALGGMLGGGEQSSQQILDKLKAEQRQAERHNADTLVYKPMKKFNKLIKRMEKDIAEAEELYAQFQHDQEEYTKGYYAVRQAMKLHCQGLLMARYKGARFDCERERVEAQAQFLSRRHAPECLIGERTPFDDLEQENMLEKVLSDSVLPPEVVVLSNLVAGGAPGANGSIQATNDEKLAPASCSNHLLARPKQGMGVRARCADAAVRDFL